MSNASENSTRSLSEAPVVAVVGRSGFVESVHRGVVVAVDADGSVLLERGDASAPSFPRSSNKPLQALAMVRAGLALRDDLLALAAEIGCVFSIDSDAHAPGQLDFLVLGCERAEAAGIEPE